MLDPERIAIIMEGCHLTEDEAIKRYKALQHDIGNDFANQAVQKLRKVILDRKMRKEHKISGKVMASGDGS